MQPNSTLTKQPPDLSTGAAVWVGSHERAHIRFVGRAASGGRVEALALGVRALPSVSAPSRLAWPRQVHSAEVLAAVDGECGIGDALYASTPGLVLAIATADCVPIAIASGAEIAAVHAGWRGIVGGVVENSISRFVAPAASLEAWIGPAVGPCCYEVGDEVAAQVIAASSSTVASTGASQKPHLDLQAAVREQLTRLGVRTVHTVAICTCCHPEWLWSYRRDGKDAGRNLAFAWLQSET
ncbi:MAG: peptidoglycan editing factor PgeF [Acidobacteriota bacterium]